MKLGSIVCLIIFILGALIGIIQIWFSLLTDEIFFKTLITLSVVFIAVLAITLVRKEYLEDKDMTDKGFID